jgi:signal transduction histidine kinase
LNAIILSAHILEKMVIGSSQEERANRLLKTLRRNAGYLTDQVNKILEENINLETETGVKLERRWFDLWPLVESLIFDLHPIAGSDSTLIFNNVPEDPTYPERGNCHHRRPHRLFGDMRGY